MVFCMFRMKLIMYANSTVAIYLLARRVDDPGCLALYNVCLVLPIRIAMEMEVPARVTVVYLGVW